MESLKVGKWESRMSESQKSKVEVGSRKSGRITVRYDNYHILPGVGMVILHHQNIGTMKVYDQVYDQFNKGYFGSCAMGIMVQSCLGGIAAMTILHHGNGLPQMIQLLIVVAACVAFNGAIISVQKPRLVFNMLVGAAVICVGIAVLNMLF